MIGTRLAHYDIVGPLGKGGMGEVYRARDRKLDREVAIKVLPEHARQDLARLERLQREAKVLASITHPNIAAVYGMHEDQGVHFIAMELVEGTTLDVLLREGGLPLGRLLDLAIPVADAIAFAHERGVIHRDIKPSNLMLDASGRVRVLDFGVAGLRGTDATGDEVTTMTALTAAGEIVGTPAYMAPEQLEGRQVDSRADVFAIGVTLYEMAAGVHPFRADSAAAVTSAILRDDPPSVIDVRPDLPADLARIIRRCLHKRVERRLQTATDIRNELEDIRAGILTGPGATSVRLTAGTEVLAERTMAITTQHVRRLSVQIPSMVGDSMSYLDNQRDSDVFVACLHGIGADQSHFEEALGKMPFRAVALSMYGFGESARSRPALPIADHNQLLTRLLEEIYRRIPSSTRIIVGHSSGADQLLRILASDAGTSILPDGVVLLGPTVEPGAGLVSGPLARLTGDPADILRSIREVSSAARDLDSWLWLHDYLVKAFQKFGRDVEGLQAFARDLIDVYDRDEFFEHFRTLTDRVPHVRCVFARDELDAADHALQRHIGDNALGERYSEEMIVREPVGHVELRRAAVLQVHVEDIVRRCGRRNV